MAPQNWFSKIILWYNVTEWLAQETGILESRIHICCQKAMNKRSKAEQIVVHGFHRGRVTPLTGTASSLPSRMLPQKSQEKVDFSISITMLYAHWNFWKEQMALLSVQNWLDKLVFQTAGFTSGFGTQGRAHVNTWMPWSQASPVSCAGLKQPVDCPPQLSSLSSFLISWQHTIISYSSNSSTFLVI